MDINFASFEEYLKTLSSASRNGLKRKFKEIDGKIEINLEITGRLDEGTLSEVYGPISSDIRKAGNGVGETNN